MHASKVVALSVFSLSLLTTAAWADETATPAPKGNVFVMQTVMIKGHKMGLVLDVARLGQKAPLPDLRKPLLDGIATAADRDPF